MVFVLAQWLSQFVSSFRVFDYVTVRVSLAMLVSLLISLWLGKPFIRLIQRFQFGQVVRVDGPKTHLDKSGTPTMGGILILFSLFVSTLLFSDLSNRFIWLLLGGTMGFGLIGLWDDLLKILLKNHKGLIARFKFALQVVLALVVLLVLVRLIDPSLRQLYIPAFKQWSFALPVGLFVVLGMFVLVGSSNAVNMSDGLDGLAAVLVLMVAAVLGLYAYVGGSPIYAEHLHQPYVRGGAELAVFCAAMIGSCLGFLWFNSHPASIFMGDVGSLSLGFALGLVAFILRQELILFICSLVLVAETLSVLIQVGSYKLRKKRVFKMAPLHHHFELLGLHETKVFLRFSIIGFIFALLSLLLLKVR